MDSHCAAPSLFLAGKAIRVANVAVGILPSPLLRGNRDMQFNNEYGVGCEWMSAERHFSRPRRHRRGRRLKWKGKNDKAIPGRFQQIKTFDWQAAAAALMKRAGKYSDDVSLRHMVNSHLRRRDSSLLASNGGGNESDEVLLASKVEWEELEDVWAVLRNLEQKNRNATKRSHQNSNPIYLSSSSPSPSTSPSISPSLSTRTLRSSTLTPPKESIHQANRASVDTERSYLSSDTRLRVRLRNCISKQLIEALPAQSLSYINETRDQTISDHVNEILKRFWLDISKVDKDPNDFVFLNSRLIEAMIAKILNLINTKCDCPEQWDHARERKSFSLPLGSVHRYPITLWDDLSLSEKLECWTGVVNSLVTKYYIKSKFDPRVTNSMFFTEFPREELNELVRRKAELSAQNEISWKRWWLLLYSKVPRIFDGIVRLIKKDVGMEESQLTKEVLTHFFQSSINNEVHWGSNSRAVSRLADGLMAKMFHSMDPTTDSVRESILTLLGRRDTDRNKNRVVRRRVAEGAKAFPIKLWLTLSVKEKRKSLKLIMHAIAGNCFSQIANAAWLNPTDAVNSELKTSFTEKELEKFAAEHSHRFLGMNKTLQSTTSFERLAAAPPESVVLPSTSTVHYFPSLLPQPSQPGLPTPTVQTVIFNSSNAPLVYFLPTSGQQPSQEKFGGMYSTTMTSTVHPLDSHTHSTLQAPSQASSSGQKRKRLQPHSGISKMLKSNPECSTQQDVQRCLPEPSQVRDNNIYSSVKQFAASDKEKSAAVQEIIFAPQDHQQRASLYIPNQASAVTESIVTTQTEYPTALKVKNIEGQETVLTTLPEVSLEDIEAIIGDAQPIDDQDWNLGDIADMLNA